MEANGVGDSARDRALDAAELLFARRGYAAVTLRDVAAEIGIRHTSLYHHFPGGKEQLYVEAMDRVLRVHVTGLRDAVESGGESVRAGLHAVANWLLAHPPMDLIRMVHSDLPSIHANHARRLEIAVHTSIIVPVERLLEAAAQRGELSIPPGSPDVGLLAGGLIGMLESLHAMPDYVVRGSRAEMAHRLIDLSLRGWGLCADSD